MLAVMLGFLSFMDTTWKSHDASEWLHVAQPNMDPDPLMVLPHFMSSFTFSQASHSVAVLSHSLLNCTNFIMMGVELE